VRYPARGKIDDDKNLRVGARVRIEVTGEKLQKVLSVPRNAVLSEEGRSYSRIKNGDTIEKREITLGLGNRERVQVAKGLNEGDVVVIKEGKPKQ
jgi:HlyD family secretion protein